MDWIVTPFGKKKSRFYSKIKLMNKWANLQSPPDPHMRTLAQSCALYQEAEAEAGVTPTTLPTQCRPVMPRGCHRGEEELPA